MRTFRLALTGDYLNAEGGLADGDISLELIDEVPYIDYHFLESLAPKPGDTEYYKNFYSLEVAPEHIAEIDGLVVLRPWIKPSAFVNGADQLVAIARAGAGYDKIDVEACTDNDVVLFNAPDALTHSTASSALLFMLALVKCLPQQERLARNGRWDLQAEVRGSELTGRTLGIVGLGRSGRELVRLVAPFNMKIIAYSPQADPEQARQMNIRLITLEEVMREADIVSIHSNLTPEKHKMITAQHLALMKPSAYLVNVARGELLDQDALVEILRERRIAGAGLDVYEEEPLPADHPLVGLDNAILTPHWLPATFDAKTLAGEAVFGGIKRVARGELPDNIINKAVLDRPKFKAKLARFEVNRE